MKVGGMRPYATRKRCCARRPNRWLWTDTTLDPAKAVPPMQARAVHLCHRSPRRSALAWALELAAALLCSLWLGCG